MSFFDFRKKTVTDRKLRAIVSGRVIPIEAVPDPTFSEKILGDGIAFEPKEETVLAPASGVITSASSSMPHAVGMELDMGLEILIHIGIDTVNMQGKGFTMLVKEGQKIKAGQPLVNFDRKAIASAGYSDMIMLIFTNSDQEKSLKMYTGMEAVAKETIVAELENEKTQD